MSEFDIIQQHFANWQSESNSVVLGIGDDAALIEIPDTHHLVVTTDLFLPDIHFPENTSAADIAYKALAVNLSDLAAMAAKPGWFTLSLAVPEVDSEWLESFSKSLSEAAQFYNIALVGGDTNQGPLTISIQAMGQVPKDKALRRDTAEPGDYIYCTGTLGDAALGLSVIQGKHTVMDDEDRQYFYERLNRPIPRVGAGMSLRQGASAAIDISDGLVSDLSHILTASGGLGALINLEELPLSEPLNRHLGEIQAWEMALSGGDDYELCFTVSGKQQGMLETALSNAGCSFTCIGRVTGKRGIQFQNSGANVSLNLKGFEHFNSKDE